MAFTVYYNTMYFAYKKIYHTSTLMDLTRKVLEQVNHPRKWLVICVYQIAQCHGPADPGTTLNSHSFIFIKEHLPG
jgi:hypothetical protein